MNEIAFGHPQSLPFQPWPSIMNAAFMPPPPLGLRERGGEFWGEAGIYDSDFTHSDVIYEETKKQSLSKYESNP